HRLYAGGAITVAEKQRGWDVEDPAGEPRRFETRRPAATAAQADSYAPLPFSRHRSPAGRKRLEPRALSRLIEGSIPARHRCVMGLGSADDRRDDRAIDQNPTK